MTAKKLKSFGHFMERTSETIHRLCKMFLKKKILQRVRIELINFVFGFCICFMKCQLSKIYDDLIKCSERCQMILFDSRFFEILKEMQHLCIRIID